MAHFIHLVLSKLLLSVLLLLLLNLTKKSSFWQLFNW